MSTIPATPQSLQHALLRPVILEILRAAGFTTAKPSVVDAVTDMANKYLAILAQTTAQFAAHNHHEFELTLTDVRMAMEEVGALSFGKSIEDQIWDGEDDASGVEELAAWCNGPVNAEIRRIAKDTLSEDGGDYIASLKKKYTKTNDDTRYHGTVLGKPAEMRPVPIEGGPVSSITAWHAQLKKQKTPPITPGTPRESRHSTRASSGLSSLGDNDIDMPDFD